MLKFGYRFNNRRLLSAFIVTGLSFVSVVVSRHAGAQGAHSVAPVTAPATDATMAAKRFPQPVRVGDLANRLVLEPSNHQSVLGRVDSVSRDASGRLFLVVRYGGVLGIGTRKIGVPLETTTLLGQFMQIADIPQDRLEQLPVFDSAAMQVLADNEVVRVGINRN
jgi:hypothetical protein